MVPSSFIRGVVLSLFITSTLAVPSRIVDDTKELYKRDDLISDLLTDLTPEHKEEASLKNFGSEDATMHGYKRDNIIEELWELLTPEEKKKSAASLASSDYKMHGYKREVSGEAKEEAGLRGYKSKSKRLLHRDASSTQPALFEILSKKLVREAQDKNALQTDRVFVRAEEAALFEARGKALAVLVGTGLVLWLPYFLLKRLGYRRLAALLTRFTDADAGRGPQHTLKWSLLTTSAFSRTAVVNVTLPSSPPTNFHPQAYLPPVCYHSIEKNFKYITDRILCDYTKYMGRADSDSFTQFAPPPGAPPRSVPVNANDGEWEDEKRQ
ncbi:hypothetical protein P7C70_g3157, partial [Phenoliferia sp. Uapishka_3]